MKTQPVLTDEFKDAITNLVIDDHAPSGQLAVRDDARAVLQAGLEQTLVDPDAFYDYLHYLNHTHRIRHPFRHSELLPPEVAGTVVLHGLAKLKPEQLAELALNPYQLAELQELLSESEPSDVWWPIFKRYNREAALLAEAFDEHREELDAIFTPRETAHESRQLVGAFGDRDADAPPADRPSTKQRPWHEEVPLGGANVEWLQVTDQAKADADRQRTVRIDFAWQSGLPGVLTVRLGAPLLLGGSCTGVVELSDSADESFATGQLDGIEFYFQLSPVEFARAANVIVTYDRPGKYRVRITIPFSPPI